MRADDELARYREAMGADAVVRQFAADGRRGDGVCKTCGAPALRAHKATCVQMRRPAVERVK